MNTKKILKELENRFGAERITADSEQLRFLEERDLLFHECCWDFDVFVKHYQLIKRYGLEEKCLESLAWKIEVHLNRSDIDELKSSDFFSRFGKHKHIQFALLERGINKYLK